MEIYPNKFTVILSNHFVSPLFLYFPKKFIIIVIWYMDSLNVCFLFQNAHQQNVTTRTRISYIVLSNDLKNLCILGYCFCKNYVFGRKAYVYSSRNNFLRFLIFFRQEVGNTMGMHFLLVGEESSSQSSSMLWSTLRWCNHELHSLDDTQNMCF